MNEVKQPRKPLIYYYTIAMMILLLFNFLVMPWLAELRVQEVDYGTCMTMTDEGNIGLVQIDSTQITFTDKEEKQIYKTGLLDDPGLTERLHAAGATFSG